MSAMRRIERVASAAKRRALREALKAAELKGREIRSEILLAKKETSQLSILAKEAALADMVRATDCHGLPRIASLIACANCGYRCMPTVSRPKRSWPRRR